MCDGCGEYGADYQCQNCFQWFCVGCFDVDSELCKACKEDEDREKLREQTYKEE